MMTIQQVAGRAGVSVDTVRRRIRDGSLPARRDRRGRWLIDPADAAREFGVESVEGELLAWAREVRAIAGPVDPETAQQMTVILTSGNSGTA